MADNAIAEPGSPAAFIEKILSDALAVGHNAASARLSDFNETPGRSASFQMGPDVTVAITYRHDGADAEVRDVVRLDRAWSLIDAGATLVRLACPDEHLPYAYVAAAMVLDSNQVRHDLVVIDRRGGSGALADPTKVGGQEVGKSLRKQILRYANPAERKRGQIAADKLNRQDAGLSPVKPGVAIFTSAVADRLIEDPELRGLDPGRALLQWSYKTVENGTERIVAVSDPTFDAEPLSRHATAGVNTLMVDEEGVTKGSYPGSNRHNRQLDPTGDDMPPPAGPPAKTSLNSSDPNWASEVRVSRVAPNPKVQTSGRCSSCGIVVDMLNDDDECEKCWRVGNVDRQKLREGPTPAFDRVYRKPDDHEMKPNPDDPRWQNDPTGDLASGLAQENLALALAELTPEDSSTLMGLHELGELSDLLVGAGLTKEETTVLQLRIRGRNESEIGAHIGRSQSQVSRIASRAIGKIEKS
jgi:hypothetical protein